MTHFYEPRLGHGLPHDPFNAIVGPRPIGWVSTQSAQGVLNLAPYSFFNAFNYIPPIVGFSSIGAKDSLRNIQETGEFVWNLVTRPLADQMNQTCAPVGPEVNEFELAHLTPVASRLVKVPRVAESPVTFECRCTQILQLEGINGEVAHLVGVGRSGGHPYRRALAQRWHLRHRQRRPRDAWRRPRRLLHRGARELVQDVAA
jgi:flavin reductase (DIM6/NTAB) family NADH-FMN oxidoreductase RutF